MAGLTQPMIEELEIEKDRLQKVLEAIPADKLDWKPGEKAMTLGQVALHTANIPGSVMQMAQEDRFDAATIDFEPPSPADKAEILATFERSFAEGAAAMQAMDDARAMGTWSIVAGENELMSMPRIGVIRHILINHMIHHRGQMTTYFRCLGTPVPATYGMSADENPFADMMAAAGGN